MSTMTGRRYTGRQNEGKAAAVCPAWDYILKKSAARAYVNMQGSRVIDNTGLSVVIAADFLHSPDHFFHLLVRQGIIKRNAENPLIKPFRIGT